MPAKKSARRKPKNPFKDLPSLKKLAKKIATGGKAPDLQWRFDVGGLIEQLWQDSQTLGFTDRIGLLAEAIDDRRITTAWLIQHRLFHERYGKRLKKVLAENAKGGFELTWSHIMPLMTIEPDQPKRPKRDAFEADCRDKQWSVSQLRSEIRLQFPKRKSGGRPFAGYRRAEGSSSGQSDRRRKKGTRITTVPAQWFANDVATTSGVWLRKYRQFWKEVKLSSGKQALDVEFLDEMLDAIIDLKAKIRQSRRD